jgi:hypothetical protein
MTLKFVTEGTQPKEVQNPSQPLIPQPRPVAEVRTHPMYICSFSFLMQSVVLLLPGLQKYGYQFFTNNITDGNDK